MNKGRPPRGKNPRERGGEKPRENQEKKLEKAKGGYGRAGVRKKGVKNFGAIWGARAECLESQKGGRFQFAYPNPSLGLAKGKSGLVGSQEGGVRKFGIQARCCLRVVAYSFVYACVHYICACYMVGLHGFMVALVHATLGLCRFGLGCMAALESRVDSCGTLVNAALHKVIQGNRVRRYAQGTYNQDHVSMFTNVKPLGKNKTSRMLCRADLPQRRLKRTAASNHSLAMYHVVLAERKLTSYVYAVGDDPAWEVGALQFGIRAEFLPSSFTVLLPAPQF
ncbi:hypothetical protein TIFTF001_049585 [Ficus carica]|uniref:Uncharacterized protein n=1 Tax=Ficus carica TaxID=3494 RepID=A0AA87Z4R7_FICCA|nr:hypothetical protein TIFTF001_049585 [Ficus carica]